MPHRKPVKTFHRKRRFHRRVGNKRFRKSVMKIAKRVVNSSIEKCRIDYRMSYTLNGASAAAYGWTDPTMSGTNSWSTWWATDSNVTANAGGSLPQTPKYILQSTICSNGTLPVNYTNNYAMPIKGAEYTRRSLRIKCKFVPVQFNTTTSAYNTFAGNQDVGSLLKFVFFVCSAAPGCDDADMVNYFQNVGVQYMQPVDPTIVTIHRRIDVAWESHQAPAQISWRWGKHVFGKTMKIQTSTTGVVSSNVSRGKWYLYFQYYPFASQVIANTVYHVFPFGFCTYKYMDS